MDRLESTVCAAESSPDRAARPDLFSRIVPVEVRPRAGEGGDGPQLGEVDSDLVGEVFLWEVFDLAGDDGREPEGAYQSRYLGGKATQLAGGLEPDRRAAELAIREHVKSFDRHEKPPPPSPPPAPPTIRYLGTVGQPTPPDAAIEGPLPLPDPQAILAGATECYRPTEGFPDGLRAGTLLFVDPDMKPGIATDVVAIIDGKVRLCTWYQFSRKCKPAGPHYCISHSGGWEPAGEGDRVLGVVVGKYVPAYPVDRHPELVGSDDDAAED